MTTTPTALRFTPGSSFGGLCYYPANDAAKAKLSGKRRTLRSDELVALVVAGHAVELGLPTFLGAPETWVALVPSVADAEQGVNDAEDALRSLPEDCTLEDQISASLVARIAEDGLDAATALAEARAKAYKA